MDHDPQRRAARANEPVPTGPLGDVPDYLEPLQVVCWNEIVSQIAPGVLTNCDRLLIEKLARLRAREREGEYLKAAEHSLMIKCYSLLGMTPADRSKIIAARPPEQSDEDDDWEEFTSPANVKSDVQ